MDTSLEYHKLSDDYINLAQPIEYIDYIQKHMTKMDCHHDDNNQVVFNLNKENKNSIQPECKTKKRKSKKQIIIPFYSPQHSNDMPRFLL